MKKSVIIRGSVFYDKHPQNFINEVVDSIRSWFSDEIILSTWEGQEKYIDKNLAVDKVVLTPDPGPGPIQHWNRQVLSYQRGLEVSEGEKIMVTRSDMIHKKNPFGYLDMYPNNTDNFKVFSNKLIVSNMMTIRPDSDEYPNCFRICDWFQVGYMNDIRKWSDVMESILTFDQTKINELTCTETLWFLSVLKNKFGNMINIYDSSNIDKFAWEAIVNNFIVLDTKSTLHAVNSNWDFQPEYCPCYLNEETYKELYEEVNK
jgi:hypothetical protein